jgi:hypothetical protein
LNKITDLTNAFKGDPKNLLCNGGILKEFFVGGKHLFIQKNLLIIGNGRSI